MKADAVTLETGYRPGVVGEVIRLHMDYYAGAWGFGLAFESAVAAQLADLMRRYRDGDLLLMARDAGGRAIGTVTLDAHPRPKPDTPWSRDADIDGTTAQVRWFVTAAEARGIGLGRRLIGTLIDHATAHGRTRLQLTTFHGLDAARHLYESLGFGLVGETEVDRWGGGVRELHFERTARAPA